MEREVIKRKIEKLLALSESTNESEAMSAVRTARKLMLKYHISMAEGETAGGESPLSSLRVSVKELRFKRTPMRQHHLMLAFLLAKNFRCKTFHQYGEIPCVRCLTKEEIDGAYEENTGHLIVDSFKAMNKDVMAVPAVLCKNHGPFAWGKDAHEAVHNAVVLEEVAKMAYRAETINPRIQPAPQELQDKHYYRKHGANAYYGQ